MLLWGLFATGVLTLVMTGAQQLGWSRMSLPFMIGTMFTDRRGPAIVAGSVAHLLFGLAFASLYALVFESWGEGSWLRGLLLGLYHGLFILVVVLHYLPNVHPRMASKHHGPTPTRELEPPGALGLHYGRRTPLIALAAHLAYGAILGAFYVPAG